MLRHPRSRPLVALGALLVVLLAGCASPGADLLLVAEAPSPEQQVDGGLTVHGVRPGDELGDDTVLSRRAQGLVEMTTVDRHGLPWTNRLGREWEGSVLMGLRTGQEEYSLTTGEPGEEQDELVRAPQISPTVLRRGTFVLTPDGCLLASSADSADEVGQGRCTISSDERWVASWSSESGGMSVRDLRSDDVTEIDGIEVLNAVALSTKARVLAITSDDDGFRGVLYDAASGDEVARTDAFASFAVAPPTTGSTGLVLRAEDETGSELLYMDADGVTTSIDRGPYLLPLTNDGGSVSYVRYELEDPTASSVRRWSDGDEPETLLEGFIGAGSPDGDSVVVTRETDQGIEFYVEEASGDLHRELTLPRQAEASSPAEGGVGIRVADMLTLDGTVHLVVEEEGVGSYVRLDLSGKHSDVPVQQRPNLRLESIDSDGTALLAQFEQTSETDGRTNLLVVRPNEDEPDERASVGLTGANLIHDGVVYITDASDQTNVVVRSVRATGSDRDLVELYPGMQIIGATWPEQGGATEAFYVTLRMLAEQQQQALAAQGAGPGGPPGGPGAPGAPGGAPPEGAGAG